MGIYLRSRADNMENTQVQSFLQGRQRPCSQKKKMIFQLLISYQGEKDE